MSGGVDSSVAVALLKEQGYDLVGITMNIWPTGRCCGVEAAHDAKKVADKLEIPHYTLNFREVFQKTVIDDFVSEYKNGRTPNPCIRCNQFLKFDHLLSKAQELGCDYISTGHYVRIQKSKPKNPKSKINPKSEIPTFKLLKGKDARKDQSYVLYMLSQETLKKTLFPLGEWTKEEVRKKAKDLGLPVHDKEESQEICFVPDDNYGNFLREHCPEVVQPGPIKDKTGKVVGQHEGVAFCTLGQRKGLGAHKSQPKYVIQIIPQENTVVIGDQADTTGKELVADQVTYVSGKGPTGSLNIAAKIRYNSVEASAILFPLKDDKIKIAFEESQRSVTPGQSVVFYDGEQVLGGGIIIIQ